MSWKRLPNVAQWIGHLPSAFHWAVKIHPVAVSTGRSIKPLVVTPRTYINEGGEWGWLEGLKRALEPHVYTCAS